MTCAVCRDPDPFVCVQLRHEMPSADEIDEDGACECCCHIPEDWDDNGSDDGDPWGEDGRP